MYHHTHHCDGIKGISLHDGPDPHCKDTEISPGIRGWKYVIHASPGKEDKKASPRSQHACNSLHSFLFPHKHLTLGVRIFLHTDRHKQGVLIPREGIPTSLTPVRPVPNHSPHCEQPVSHNDNLWEKKRGRHGSASWQNSGMTEVK